jgi:hypothetical protein
MALSEEMIAFFPGCIQHQLGVIQLTSRFLDFFRSIVFFLYQFVSIFTHRSKMRLPPLNLSL